MNSFKEQRAQEEDMGPTDALPQDILDLEYRHFFGSDSPLSSPPSSPLSSPPTSRSASPTPNSKFQGPSMPQRAFQTSESPHQAMSKQGGVATKLKSLSKKLRDKRKGKKARKQHRVQEAVPMSAGDYVPRSETQVKHIEPSVPLKARFDVGKDVPAASTGWIGLRDQGSRVYSLKELQKNFGFALHEWDGKTAILIVDKNARVIAVLVGKPDDEGWDAVQLAAFDALQKSRERCRFPQKSLNHRRGKFPALNKGISFGGGQTKPGNLHHSVGNAKELHKLANHASFKRISGFASGAFASWAPKLFEYYESTLDGLTTNDPNLKRNFQSSPWASAAFNFGPRTESAKHRDFANLPFGWCGITSLGRFNPKKGGHIVLWELKLIVEFPPGSTVLIPSGAISHSNTPIGSKEERCSFTQYSAGGLFRWAEHGYQKEEFFWGDLSGDRYDKEIEESKSRLRRGLDMFSTLTELKKNIVS